MTQRPHELTCDECKEVKLGSSLGAPLNRAGQTVNRKWYSTGKNKTQLFVTPNCGLLDFPAHRMWTVQHHVTAIHEITATPFITNKGKFTGIHDGLNTQAPSSPIPGYKAMKTYWEVEAKLHPLLT